MSAVSSATFRRHSPDPGLAVQAGQLLRVRTIWTIPLIVASAVVAVMTVLYISSVVNPLAHLRGLLVAVVNQDRGATIGSHHLNVGEQVQAGLVANPAVSHWLSLKVSSPAPSEQAMDRGALYAVVVIPPDFTANLLSVSALNTAGAAAPQIHILTNERAGTVGVQLATGILQPALAAASHQIGQHLTALVPATAQTGATRVILADPVTATTAQYRSLPASRALRLSAFYIALLALMCGFLAGAIINSVVDSALGYAATETGPRWRQRPPVPINRWQTLLIKWAIVAALTAGLTAVVLMVAAGALGMDAPHPALLWLFTRLCAASVGVGTIAVFAMAGAFRQLIAMLLVRLRRARRLRRVRAGTGPTRFPPRPEQRTTSPPNPGRHPLHHVLQRPSQGRSHPGNAGRRARTARLAGRRHRHRQVVRPQGLLPPRSQRPRPRQRRRPGLQIPTRHADSRRLPDHPSGHRRHILATAATSRPRATAVSSRCSPPLWAAKCGPRSEKTVTVNPFQDVCDAQKASSQPESRAPTTGGSTSSSAWPGSMSEGAVDVKRALPSFSPFSGFCTNRWAGGALERHRPPAGTRGRAVKDGPSGGERGPAMEDEDERHSR
jgi:YhgE/Pip-like protein